MGWTNSLLARGVGWLPTPVLARVAGRYIAGPKREDVLRLVAKLEAAGVESTVDLLGENVRTEVAARAVSREYIELLDAYGERGLRAHISVKLTHLGLRQSEDLAQGLLSLLVARAESSGSFVRIDMEDSSTTDAALRVFRRLRERSERVGIAIQAYLYRSAQDVDGLMPLRPNLRICKGIYREPAELARQDPQAIRESFVGLVRRVLGGGGYAAIATHDPWILERCEALSRDLDACAERHEYQMLLGVGEALRPRLLNAKKRLRVYCPYGPDWRAYSLRRLRENPKLVSYVLRDLFRR
jgi:proline dehydrogenase